MATATASGNTSGPSGIAEPMSGDFASLRLPAHMQRSSVLAAKYQPEGYLAALDELLECRRLLDDAMKAS